jgi:hypothetical protein
VWFDIAASVKLFLLAEDIPRALLLLRTLWDKDVRLIDADGMSLVWVAPTKADDGVLARVRDRLQAAGLVQGHGKIVWELPRDER